MKNFNSDSVDSKLTYPQNYHNMQLEDHTDFKDWTIETRTLLIYKRQGGGVCKSKKVQGLAVLTGTLQP